MVFTPVVALGTKTIVLGGALRREVTAKRERFRCSGYW